MENFKVIWSVDAKEDLVEIIEFIKLDSIDTAKNTLLKIKELTKDLYFSPERGRVVPELNQIGISKYRELIFQRWRIIYKLSHETVSILMIIDSRRNLEDILFKRLVKY